MRDKILAIWQGLGVYVAVINNINPEHRHHIDDLSKWSKHLFNSIHSPPPDDNFLK